MAENQKENQGVDSRVAAARLLNQVLQHRDTTFESLTRICAKMRLEDADRRLVHAISGSVFRNLPYIDTVLRRVMDRKRDPNPIMLHHLLRVGVAQLLFMDVAPHAAVHATVSATGSLHLTKQKSLVNAVLRSVQRQKDELLAGLPDALSMLPEWLQKRWIGHYGESEARTLAGVMRREAPLDLSIRDADASLQWAQKLGGETLIVDSIRTGQSAGQITSWSGFSDGSWWVQDLAASLPIRLLGDVAGKSVLDVCAAPGGKTLQLARSGARVTALDLAPVRMLRLTENLSRVSPKAEVKTVVADALQWRPDSPFDIVVLDAPCTSTGTLRRHPELPWIHEENDVGKMTLLQRDLLCHCADWLVHDGILLYCTCSMEVEEGENQVESFLAANSNFREIRDIPAVVQPFLKRGVKNIGFRSNPPVLADKGGMDGFFMALLQKI